MKFVTLTTEHTHRGINYINYSKQKKLRYDKINPDPYGKWAARRVAATPAVRSHRVGPASRTPPGPACRLLEDPHLAISCAHGTNARQLHRAPATDSRPPADPTSRMGRAKWRILHAPHGRARHFHAKRIQRVDRCSSARHRTGNWKVKLMEYVLKLVELSLFCLGMTYLGAWAFVAARGKCTLLSRQRNSVHAMGLN